MIALAAAAAALSAYLLVDARRERWSRVLTPDRSRRLGGARAARGGRDREWLLASAAGLAATLVVGGGGGVVLGAATGAATGAAAFAALRRSVRRGSARDDDELLRDLAAVADLLAACVSAGSSPHEAVRESAAAVPGRLGVCLRDVVRATDLGVPPSTAWAESTTEGPAALRSLGAALSRSSSSGASPATVLEALAAELRERRRFAGEAAARRAGVVMVAPLGLCFLPAFVLIGVVPLVVGLARAALSDLQ